MVDITVFVSKYQPVLGAYYFFSARIVALALLFLDAFLRMGSRTSDPAQAPMWPLSALILPTICP